ncbi:MAG: hypothetical protein K9M57_00495 [Phycisphaerae bacterium]|nr:hypothetical protein [Phycisphaerae bacterium]
MTPLTANLKIFYQRKMIWFWYLILLAYVPQVLFDDTPSKSMNIMIISLLAGIMVASLLCDLMKRPLTFCLPGHRKLPAKLLLAIGLILNALLALIFIRTPDLSHGMLMLVVVTAASLGLTCYFFSSLGIYYTGQTPTWAGWIWPVLFLFIFFGGYKYCYIAMLAFPIPVLFVSLIANVFCLRLIGQPNHHRRLCNSDFTGIFDNALSPSGQRKAIAKALEKKTSHGQIPNWLEKLTISQLKNTADFRWKAAWGESYINFDKAYAIGRWQTIFIIPLLLLFYGYTLGDVQVGPERLRTVTDIVYILPILFVLFCQMPTHPSLLTPAGRKEKFRSSLINAIVLTLLLTLVMTIMVGAFNLIAPYMPNVSSPLNMIAGDATTDKVRTFTPPLLSHIFILPALVPMGFIPAILFGHKKSIFIMVAPVIFAMTVVFFFMWQFIEGNMIVPVLIAITLWLLFIAILQRHCKKGNLVGPGQ